MLRLLGRTPNIGGADHSQLPPGSPGPTALTSTGFRGWDPDGRSSRPPTNVCVSAGIRPRVGTYPAERVNRREYGPERPPRPRNSSRKCGPASRSTGTSRGEQPHRPAYPAGAPNTRGSKAIERPGASSGHRRRRRRLDRIVKAVNARGIDVHVPAAPASGHPGRSLRTPLAYGSGQPKDRGARAPRTPQSTKAPRHRRRPTDPTRPSRRLAESGSALPRSPPGVHSETPRDPERRAKGQIPIVARAGRPADPGSPACRRRPRSRGRHPSDRLGRPLARWRAPAGRPRPTPPAR